MKHLNRYIVESIFDDQGDDNALLADEICKIFDLESGAVTINGNTMKLELTTGGFPYIILNGDQIEKVWGMMSGVNSIVSEYVLTIEDASVLSKYVRTIEADCAGLYDSKKPVKNIKLQITGRHSELVHRGVGVDNIDVEFSFIGVHSLLFDRDFIHNHDNDHITIKNLKTNSPYMTIRNYQSWDVSVKSKELKQIKLLQSGNLTGNPGASTLLGFVHKMNSKRFARPSVNKIFREYEKQGLFSQWDILKDTNINAPGLEYLQYEYNWSKHFIIHFFAPGCQHVAYKEYTGNTGNKLYNLANGWTIGYEFK